MIKAVQEHWNGCPSHESDRTHRRYRRTTSIESQRTGGTSRGAGPVRLIVLVSEEDAAGTVWAHGLAREWADELSDSRQDLYTLVDGQPVDATRCDLLGPVPIWLHKLATIHTDRKSTRLN